MTNRLDSFIDQNASLEDGVKIWDGSHVRENVVIGSGTSIGQFAYVGPGVVIGKNCKIQNQALIYEPALIHDGVFIGPRVVITNDLTPRAIDIDGRRLTEKDWVPLAAEIETGASLGAGSIFVGAIRVGKWAMVAAGSVVVKDVLDYALVAGVPAKRIGWVGEAGVSLRQVSQGVFVCPSTNKTYTVSSKGELAPVKE